jgi:AraC-like DNA-binding protein
MLYELSTRRIAPSDRADYWRVAMRVVMKSQCDVEPPRAGTLDATVGVMPCGAIRLVTLAGTPYRATRTGHGESGVVSLMFQIDGGGSVGHGQRSACLNPGDMCIVPPMGDIVVERPADFHQVLMGVPTQQLDETLPRWRDWTATTVDAARPGVRPALDLLRFALAYRSTLDDDSRERLATTALNLLANGLADDGRLAASGRQSKLAEYHRQRIERFIDEHLRDPDLSVAMIARELGLSTRYVHKLYEKQPAHVMRQALDKRLRECQRDIGRRGTRSISEIAYGWGFNSTAHFSRAYKKQFGVCPRDA